MSARIAKQVLAPKTIGQIIHDLNRSEHSGTGTGESHNKVRDPNNGHASGLPHTVNENCETWGCKPETAPPDPKKHFWVSMIKSFVRMAGFVLLPTSIYVAVELLVIAEFIGIVEELV